MGDKMRPFEVRLKELVLKLHEINALKFGDFRMKVGINSPVYFDLRVIVSYPDVMENLSLMLYEFAEAEFECDHICGVPYTALPIATIIAVHAKKSMLMRRKEAKNYGTNKLIEGKYNPGDTCVIVEDVVTSGSSILETVRDLEYDGLKVTTAIVTVDRQQGGSKNLASQGIKMKSLITLSEVMRILNEAGKLDNEMVLKVKQYIENCQIFPDGAFKNPPKAVVPGPSRLTTSFLDRSKVAVNPTAARLLALMADKKTNLCVAADLTSTAEVLALAREVGLYVCLFKTHVDVIRDFSWEFVEELKSIAEEYNFMIMEDRKFSDIGHLVSMQYSAGVHRISSWADIVTAHPLSGDGVLKGLKSAVAGQLDKRSCFLVAEMSTEGNLTLPAYISSSMRMAESHGDFVSGIVCQSANTVLSLGLLQLTPGVKLASAGDGMGQQYSTPETAVIKRGADIAVVGRGITEATNRGKEASEFRDQLWAAYKKRVQRE